MVEYSDFRAEFYASGESTFLEKVEVIGGDIRLPLSKVKVGDSRKNAEEAYCYNEKATDEEGNTYYLEDICMLCNASKRYRIRFEYEYGSVTRIMIAVNWLA